jgi:2-keto-3-deoxy-L-rhamnonate aldolase RhmA
MPNTMCPRANLGPSSTAASAARSACGSSPANTLTIARAKWAYGLRASSLIDSSAACIPSCGSVSGFFWSAGEEVLAIGTLEHADAIANLGDIVATPGLDLLFIGPGDLATSMGLKGKQEAREVQAVIAVMETAVLNSSVVLGGVAPTVDAANAMIARTYRALVLGFDSSLLERGVSSALVGIRR